MTNLADSLTAAKAATAESIPADLAATFGAQQMQLATKAVPSVTPGTVIPDASLLSASGNHIRLSDVLAGSPAVLVFYRGGWCPYCNLTLRTYQTELLPRLERLGLKLVAISPQRPDGSLSTAEKAQLDFDVVSDPRNVLAESLGIVDDGSDEVRAGQAELGLDLTQVNEGGDVRLPMPAVAVIDGQRIVRWADVHPDYTTRSDVDAILDAVKSLPECRLPS